MLLRKADRGPEVEAIQLAFVFLDLSCAGDTQGTWIQLCSFLESGRLGISPRTYAGISKAKSQLDCYPIPRESSYRVLWAGVHIAIKLTVTCVPFPECRMQITTDSPWTRSP